MLRENLEMPFTPLHLLPALAFYFIFFRKIHSFAFFSATLLIDIEPALYIIFNVPIPQIPLIFGGYNPDGLHIVTHNFFGIVLIVAPAISILAKILEKKRKFWLRILRNARWVDYPLKTVFLSALLGAFIHLGWDLTINEDINMAFPFFYMPNIFVNHQVLDLVWNSSLVVIALSFIFSLKLRESPFRKVP